VAIGQDLEVGFVRHHWVLITIGIVALLVAGGAVITVLTVDAPGPASVDDALGRFREEGGDGEPDLPSGRPPEGVYLYAGEGEAALSFPPLTQHDGAELPATVTHRPRGCWALRVDFNTEHWQEWSYCRVGDGVVETRGRSGQEWDLGVNSAGNVSTFLCRPPNPVLVAEAEPGDEVEQTCSGSNSGVGGTTTSSGRSTFVGVETLVIGGTEVAANHLHGERTLTGGQEGDQVTDAWFRDDGLLLRYEREIEVRTNSPVGVITYTEEGEFELTALQPQT
jgi:hypothetical protein